MNIDEHLLNHYEKIANGAAADHDMTWNEYVNTIPRAEIVRDILDYYEWEDEPEITLWQRLKMIWRVK